MRAGRLDTPATLLELSADLCARELDWFWFGIQAKETIDGPYPTGLRNPAKVAIRAWYDARLRQGRYLRAGSRLFHIDSVRDFRGDGAELAITATEFVGEPAEYRPAERVPMACRVHLTHDAPYRDELGQVTDYRTRAEVLLIEVARPQVDDLLVIDCVRYVVIAYAADTDDGVVRGLWLDRVS